MPVDLNPGQNATNPNDNGYVNDEVINGGNDKINQIGKVSNINNNKDKNLNVIGTVGSAEVEGMFDGKPDLEPPKSTISDFAGKMVILSPEIREALCITAESMTLEEFGNVCLERLTNTNSAKDRTKNAAKQAKLLYENMSAESIAMLCVWLCQKSKSD